MAAMSGGRRLLAHDRKGGLRAQGAHHQEPPRAHNHDPGEPLETDYREPLPVRRIALWTVPLVAWFIVMLFLSDQLRGSDERCDDCARASHSWRKARLMVATRGRSSADWRRCPVASADHRRHWDRTGWPDRSRGGGALEARGELPRQRSSRSYASIIRANTLTIPNGILLLFGVLTITFGSWKDALFLGILIANIAIGSFQEIRSKRALDRLAALVAPQATVVRDGSDRRRGGRPGGGGRSRALDAGDQVVADGTVVRRTRSRSTRPI